VPDQQIANIFLGSVMSRLVMSCISIDKYIVNIL